ncbi:hypothetical protein [Nitratidesulfovibrio sp. SRB-5]|uniref:hypothetical protein n=1 Tax=Nitratidesulfovibrio sp. SRB-5 TaxID=2872636 RepID=UPI00102645B8|nr:hypothetical protein [Nitratidesulfovibrio sp. SRB-5]MBZ2171987.1 hypothetical protein [Nitratidesulfovibrio sp. SRB-5]RXF78535.1 hypothetical protein EKK70_00675 [Desulfovibrio sp. DS-1]
MTTSSPEFRDLLLEGTGTADTIFFRVDAGRAPGLSYGHLSRCLMLSRELRQRGTDTALLMGGLPDGVAYARSQGERVLPPTPDALRRTSARTLVIDLPYDPEPDLLEAARSAGLLLAYLDDTGRSHIAADVVLNSSILATPGMYPLVRTALLGPKHFLMPPEDMALSRRCRGRAASSVPGAPAMPDSQSSPVRPGRPSSPPSPDTRPRVVLTFGGSDPTGLTGKVLAALEKAALPLSLTVILGPGFAAENPIEPLAESLAATVIRAPERLLPILCDADLVLCAGGRTLYECTALGLTTLAIASTDNEAAVIAAFLARGMLPAGLAAWDVGLFVRTLRRILPSA